MVKGSSIDCFVDGIRLADASRQQVVECAARPAGDIPRLIYALHVGGLLHRRDDEFLTALSAADLVYADGAAVVVLARLAGASQIERSATTDIGVEVLDALAVNLGRPVRLALVGGESGLASRAGRQLQVEAQVDLVLVQDGYFDDDQGVLASLREARPDMVIVGMGMPYEAKWTYVHRRSLPPAVVMTCGGWFGFLAGEERRAPEILQRVGLEWSYRLQQDFSRLFSRYARGLVEVVRLVPGQLRQRRVGS